MTSTIPGRTIPGQTIPGQTIPGRTIPGQTIPGAAIPGAAIPGQTIPGAAIPGQTRRSRSPVLPGPDLRIGLVTVPAYRLFAVAGMGLGVLAGIAQAHTSGVVAPGVVLVVAALGALGAVGVLVVRAVRGSSDWVWHEHESVAMLVAAAVGVWIGQPLPVLDAGATGLLVVLGVGRIGCLLAACCFGCRASRSAYAVRYGEAHADAGLPAQLVGVALIPVQLVEAVGALLLAIAALAVSLPPGALLVAVLGARAALRTVLEPWRGDHAAPGPLRLSTPQSWAAATAAILLVLSGVGMLPAGPWTSAPVAALVLTAIIVAVRGVRSLQAR